MTTLMLRAVKIYVCDTFQEHANQEHIKKRFVQQLKFLDTIFEPSIFEPQMKNQFLSLSVLEFHADLVKTRGTQNSK